MGSFQDAMKKAGLSSGDPEAPETSAPDSAAGEAAGGESRGAGEGGGERKPHRDRPPRQDRPPRPPREGAGDKPAEKLEDKACAKCGTMFSPKHSKHRLCPKCADEHFTAAKEKSAADTAKPAEGSAPVARPPKRDRPPRQDRPPRPERPPQGEPHAPREGHRESREPREAPAGFPQDYLRSGYFAGGSGSVLRDQVLDSWARNVGALLVQRGLAANQMRMFYAHVKRAEASAKAGRDFNLVREELMKMRPVAAARQGRRLIPGEFADFLDRNLELVRDAASLRAFAEHFQAVAGYTAGRLRK